MGIWHSLLIITRTCFILLSWRAIIWTRLLRAAQVNHSQLLGPFWQTLKKHLECIYTKWSNVYTRGVFTIERALASTRKTLRSGYRGFWRALTSAFSADHASGHVFLTSVLLDDATFTYRIQNGVPFHQFQHWLDSLICHLYGTF